MSDKIKMIKPRITLKSIFRTTPAERKAYSKDVRKYNYNIMEQARLKKLSDKEQADYLKALENSNRKFSQSRVNYIYVTQPYVEPTPAVQKSSSSSGSRSSSSSSRGSYSPSNVKTVNGKITYTLPKKTTSMSSLLKMFKPIKWVKPTYTKNKRLFK